MARMMRGVCSWLVIVLWTLHGSLALGSFDGAGGEADARGPDTSSSHREVWDIIRRWSSNCCSDCYSENALPASCLPEYFEGADGRRHSLRIISVPYPSGIVVRHAHIGNGHVMRIATLQHSAVKVRREWSKVFTVPLFSLEQSETLIRLAEEKGNEGGGWGRSYNTGDELPSVDLPVVDVVGAEEYRDLRSFLTSSLLEAMAESFDLKKDLIHMSDLHIAKYNASKGAKRSHDLHKDESMFSFVIALNAPRKKGQRIAGHFDGGGTRFFVPRLGGEGSDDLSPVTITPSMPGMGVYFHGRVLHEGLEVTRGVRYIMVGFCSYGSPSGAGATTNHGDDKSGSLVWSELYDPVFDGEGYAHGVRSGDIIRAIEICEPMTPIGDTPAETGVSALGDTDGLRHARYRRRMVPVPPVGVSEAQWERMARSCEASSLGGENQPGDVTVMIVERIENFNDSNDR